MAKVDRFQDLNCWKKSRELVKTVYLLSEGGKMRTDFDLKSQFRRASVSSMNNIAEGFSRFSQKEFVRFLEISASSAGEVKSMLYVIEDLGYFSESELLDLHRLTDETKRLTLSLLKFIVNKNK
ncbi:MAG: four helix bundle protein [Bacteroidia bacterium]